jgi:single-stranded DNA-binding protein
LEAVNLSPVNLSVVRGPVSVPPEIRVLESGTRVATLAVRTAGADGKATSVPVTVWDPPSWVETLEPGDVVVVVGRVRRRFFRTAVGGRGAKTEVEADALAKARDRKRLAAIVRRIDATLAELEDLG